MRYDLMRYAVFASTHHCLNQDLEEALGVGFDFAQPPLGVWLLCHDALRVVFIYELNMPQIM
jgi:hypothetical protein